jgi:FAD/FMN-containing dehydrogenase
MKLAALIRELEKILGREAVLWRPDDVMLCEYDGLCSLRPPGVVVFPRNTADFVRIVEFAPESRKARQVRREVK